jgi:mono/diheme cytochrome c family protein
MKILRFVFGLLVAIATPARTGSLLQQAPAKMAVMKNRMEGDALARRAGAKLYKRECAACHGVRREGTRKAPALDTSEVGEVAPGALFWVLRNGSLSRGMPSFAHLPEAQRWQIVTFLREVRPEPAAR